MAAAGMQAGTLERTMKSADPPASNDGPVTVLTGKTFDGIVFGKPRNVFVEFYAPWCTIPQLPAHIPPVRPVLMRRLTCTCFIPRLALSSLLSYIYAGF